MKGLFKLGLTGITLGALVGTGYSVLHMNKSNNHFINEQTVIQLVKENQLPKIIPSRKVRFNSDKSDLKLTLYQYQTCPFCCKVRAFLDYYGISYDIIEVDPVLRQAIKWSNYKKVPILVAQVDKGYQPMNDSSMIISTLSTYLKEKKSLDDIVKFYPHITFYDDDGAKKSEIMNKYFLMLGENSSKNQNVINETSEERNWRKWADNVLVHTLSPNVYRTRQESFQAFYWFSDVGEWEKNFPTWERYLIIFIGASAMWLIGKRLKKKYNLKDDVRESLYDECNYWVKAVNKKGTKFMGGSKPNLSDLAVYGILSSIEGCDAFKDVLEKTKIGNWYTLMKEAINNNKGANLV